MGCCWISLRALPDRTVNQLEVLLVERRQRRGLHILVVAQDIVGSQVRFSLAFESAILSTYKISATDRNMRLPTLSRDNWTLRSGEEIHREHPESFWLPPREARANLQVGQAAKLIFEIEGEDEQGQPSVQDERMWVIVADKIGDCYLGILDNQPTSLEPADNVYLCFGAEVPFLAEHVIDIADPPSDYMRWQLAQKPERTWPRDEQG
jgi:hypothetical protein